MFDAPYTLIYWPGIPGRAEHIRLLLEDAGVAYTDTAQLPAEAGGGVPAVLAAIGGQTETSGGPETSGADIPLFAPPVLQHGAVRLSQTPNILLYLGGRLGYAGAGASGSGAAGTAGAGAADASDAADAADAGNTAGTAGTDGLDTFRVHELALTALDGLSDEVHNCHHPVSTSLYYADQKTEAVRASRQYVAARLPRFLGYFERVLAARPGGAPWLLRTLTYADLVLFQCVDGTAHQFPRAVAAARAGGQYPRVFALCGAVRARPRIAAYLASSRRQAYGDGIYRYYAELDVEAE